MSSFASSGRAETFNRQNNVNTSLRFKRGGTDFDREFRTVFRGMDRLKSDMVMLGYRREKGGKMCFGKRSVNVKNAHTDHLFVIVTEHPARLVIDVNQSMIARIDISMVYGGI